MAHKLISKAEAKAKGDKTYFTGKPCPRGHHAPRYVNSDKCIECHGERNKRRKRGKAGKTASTVAATVVPVVAVAAEPIKDWRYYIRAIEAAWQKAVGSIIETGKLLIEAKAKVDHGDWGKLAEELPFSERAAQMLVAVAANPILSNANHGSDLPPSWRTLYELSKLDDEVLLARIEDGTISPKMERKDVALITGAIHPKTKLRRRSKADERIIELNEEIKRKTAHIDELEAARETGIHIDDEDDDATVARKILEWLGKDRLSRVMEELDKLNRAAAA